MRLLRLGLAVAWLLAGLAPAAAERASRCLAMAGLPPVAYPVAFRPAQAAAEAATIRYVGHSTFLIGSPAGIVVATDYAGWAGPGVVPTVATMNRAHPTHFTESPDPRIAHVLRGWDPGGGKAEHHLAVDDVLIRNVTTDIRGFGFGFDGEGPAVRIPDGNSIFIFETAGLCIGHLGHLHHRLEPEDLAFIGQLDVVMVPVDGAYTMDVEAMIETLDVLKARLILPMHYFGAATLQRFLARLGEHFPVERRAASEIVVAPATLPQTATVLVLAPGN